MALPETLREPRGGRAQRRQELVGPAAPRVEAHHEEGAGRARSLEVGVRLVEEREGAGDAGLRLQRGYDLPQEGHAFRAPGPGYAGGDEDRAPGKRRGEALGQDAVDLGGLAPHGPRRHR